MIRKTIKLLITFHTTTAAMAMENVCRQCGEPGRLVPVPGSISAGCGLAWCSAPEKRDALESLMRSRSITWQEMHQCLV